MKVLIANRGEVAARISSACTSLGIEHKVMDEEGGPSSFVDIESIATLASTFGHSHVHAGIGFLSESAALAAELRRRGIAFVGPSGDVLALVGDKAKAKDLARECGLPVAADSGPCVSIGDALSFYAKLNKSVMVKALSGGGGRGIRVVHSKSDLPEAFVTCQREALTSFGNGAVFLEEYIAHAKHIEIQIVGDQFGNVAHLGDRECSLQRKNQKLIEVAPSPSLSPTLRSRLIESALILARKCNYQNLGTVEFLVPISPQSHTNDFYFLEVNPRLQVEHTVTEEIYGIDLLFPACAFRSDCICGGLVCHTKKAFAIQCRVNAETYSKGADGSLFVSPSTGAIMHFSPPLGRNVRVDTLACVGMNVSAQYDSLLAKVIVSVESFGNHHSNLFSTCVETARRALVQFQLIGVDTNIDLLYALLGVRDVAKGLSDVDTGFVERWLEDAGYTIPAAPGRSKQALIHRLNTEEKSFKDREKDIRENGWTPIHIPLTGTIEQLAIKDGDSVAKGQEIAIILPMKMEHVVRSPCSGIIQAVYVTPKETVSINTVIASILPSLDSQSSSLLSTQNTQEIQATNRTDLEESNLRHSFTLDASREKVISKLHSKNLLSAREKIALLCGNNTFFEYNALAIAAQRTRRSIKDLIANTPADGFITGISQLNVSNIPFAAFAYDVTVLAGTQGFWNHKKLDRLLDVAIQRKLPLIAFCDGGGGRPGDVDALTVAHAGLDLESWSQMGALRRRSPCVGVVSGNCFAGNAALLGCCDLIIATKDSSIGMGGPAMVEGGGLGVYKANEIGPALQQSRNGTIDVLADTETEAAQWAKLFVELCSPQPEPVKWECDHNQELLRSAIPLNSRRVYDIRATVIGILIDTTTPLFELQRDYAPGIITALVRIEGIPIAIIANNASHNGGAIDHPGALKMSRFVSLCDRRRIPIITLCDTPGFMVGPEAEKSGQVKAFGDLFVAGESISVPVITIVLRKAVGLGAMAMALGSLHRPQCTVSWPTGEFAGMGVEGAVRLGFKKELKEAGKDAGKLFERMVEEARVGGRAVNAGAFCEFDAVIDPKDTRKWIVQGVRGWNSMRESRL
ncbi:carbamoyl-phosphate synthase L chain ATP-binding protein [Rhizoclosmatium globosum]|uniref:Carbamoyl-phosphate synthase L chain ATP-binding protein n=1 Tax=Rhizoclosmatium globosum TaxID=329046 RepID=A0A1Y2C2G8_9FUNG|nr:carbamoyl-phosphate synthase L chain ATP-binding protein [Rhizoclosmatium globosum]|eukprot:ORY41084.1 carbamoyl-phosphate synthase L chain ATP-binding protein [Rhizoclosmatium globosum]